VFIIYGSRGMFWYTTTIRNLKRQLLSRLSGKFNLGFFLKIL
jgi:hypothetical protein